MLTSLPQDGLGGAPPAPQQPNTPERPLFSALLAQLRRIERADPLSRSGCRYLLRRLTRSRSLVLYSAPHRMWRIESRLAGPRQVAVQEPNGSDTGCGGHRCGSFFEVAVEELLSRNHQVLEESPGDRCPVVATLSTVRTPL